MKKRLDLLLVDKGFEISRERAKALIMAGIVYVDNQKADKAGMDVDIDSRIEVRGESLAYVSRGGLKLEKAIKSFRIKLTDLYCVDIGASTGGFTDCMLQNGARTVYAVDVGYGQLAWKLRSDNRVVNLERTNIRYITEEQIPDKIDFISIDVSFISLKLVLPIAAKLLSQKGSAVCLIKPQFEAGKDKVGKNGVVRDTKVHKQVIENCINYASLQGFQVLGLEYSPVKGPKGNIEYLMYIGKDCKEQIFSPIDINHLVEAAHNNLQNEGS